ncbi:MAG TPA: ABC transporter permease [Acidobacteriaceae bacterium]|jgi:predicted permease|nr:ABC transporter permease [Acidobacteriaceae bacterium]
MRHILGYFRFGFRQLRKNPTFTVTAVIALALGIGSTTAVFSLVDAVLLKPLPFPHSDRLVWITQEDHSTGAVVPEILSYPDYFDWRAQNHTMSGLASWKGATLTLTGSGQPQELNVETVSSNFFRVLGAAPILGRDFRQDEELAGNRAVMLSYALWQSRFGADPRIAGRSIVLNGQPYTVTGVMPKNFEFPIRSTPTDVWSSIAPLAEGNHPETTNRGDDSLSVIGRLKPGVTVEQTRADLSVIARNLASRYSDTNKWYTTAAVTPELRQLVGDTRFALEILLSAVALVLLIACVNVAGLLLARGARRSAEIALRGALGASRAEIVRQLLAESVLLALIGGGAGIALAKVILTAVVALLPTAVPRLNEVSLNLPVLMFAVGVSLITGLLFGVLPALRISRLRPAVALREGMRSVASGHARHTLQNWLVIGETSLSLVLLVGAGLLLRSFSAALHAEPGFDPHGVLTARFSMPDSSYNHDQKIQFVQQLLGRLAVVPGVQSASAGWPLPMSASFATTSFTVQGHPVAQADHPSEAIGVTLPGYFSTLRIQLLAGRDFSPLDKAKSAPVAIVSQAFAKKYFPGANPLGLHLRSDEDGAPREIVGVVGDVKQQGLTMNPVPQYFLPWTQVVITNPYICLRTSSNPSALENTVRAVVASMDADIPLYRVHPLDDYVLQSAAQSRFQALLLSGFAAIALLLAAVGLYGVLSYVVQQRGAELALRLAVGAQRSDILRLIVLRGMTLAFAGEAAGLVVAVCATRFLETLLYGVKPLDVVTFISVSLLLLFVALLASAAPAYRAAQTDPITTLRTE